MMFLVTVMSGHLFYLQTKLQANEISSRECRTIDVSGITQSTFVEIILIAVEDILHASVDLQFRPETKRDVVSELDAHIEERRCDFLAVFLDISGKMLHEHRTSVNR